jgi:hypothetical protein
MRGSEMPDDSAAYATEPVDGRCSRRRFRGSPEPLAPRPLELNLTQEHVAFEASLSSRPYQ